MADQTTVPDPFAIAEITAVPPTRTGQTERLVRETWRQYYCARLAEAQFGPDSIEASLAHSRALDSYRELRGTLREMDPYYRPPAHRSPSTPKQIRHLTLVRDEPAADGPAAEA